MGKILLGPRIGTADNAGYAPDSAVDDIVVEWFITAPERTAEHVFDILMGESVDSLGGA